MTITQAGTVIENKIIDGSLRVTAANVTIKNCQIVYNSWWGIDAEGAKNIVIQDCDIVGPGYNGHSTAAILGSGTFLRNDISGVEHGITLTSGSSVVRGNYIHDGGSNLEDPHIGGVSLKGGQSGVVIDGNTIIGKDTSDVFLQDIFGPISDVEITNNYLAGNSGYPIYVEGRFGNGTTDVTISGNIIVKGHYGYISISQASPEILDNIQLLPGQEPPDQQVDTFTGTDGNDYLPAEGQSHAGDEVFRGLGGNDVLVGGPGADTLDGGDGVDTASYITSRVGVTVNLSTGVGSGGDAQGDTLISIENLTGSRFADTLIGNDSANLLRDSGGEGNDLRGLDGNDLYQVYSSDTKIVEGSGGGTADRVMAGVDYALGAGVRVEILSTNGSKGLSAINLTGNEFSQTIWGNSGDNRIDGKGGADILKGLGGADTFVFSTAPGSGNVDQIADFKSGVDTIEMVRGELSGEPYATLPSNASSGAFFWASATGQAHDSNDRIIYNTETGALYYDADGSGSGAAVQFATLTGAPDLKSADFSIV